VATRVDPPTADEMTFAVEITVEGKPGASAELLRTAINEYLQRALKYPPDMRFDWTTARCDVVERDVVRTPR